MYISSSKQVIVIGCGAAGFSAALSLAERGWQVKIIERNTLGSGSTGRNPGRMGLGLHYSDLNTAIMYLRASFDVQWHYPGYLVGKGESFGRGRYYITKDTTVPKEQILHTYQALQVEYERLVREKARLENMTYEAAAERAFGLNFYRELSSTEISSNINMENVDIAIECAEHIFDWPKFSDFIRHTILQHPNIELIEYAEVKDIKLGVSNLHRYSLVIEHKGLGQSQASIQTIETDYVVNSTWENIEAINEHVGIHMPANSRTLRLKCLLIVKLPEVLVNENSAFFCMGEHCMFSNMGNGYGMMTYAKMTNMEITQGLKVSEEAERYLQSEVAETEIAKIASEILIGVSQYIPKMALAEIVDVKFGIIRTEGMVSRANLHSPLSSIAKRDYDGVQSLQLGWIVNPAIKLFYFLNNGKVIAGLLEEQFNLVDPYLKHAINNMKQKYKYIINFNAAYERVINSHLTRNTPTELTKAAPYIDRVIKTIQRKNLVMHEIKTKNKNFPNPIYRRGYGHVPSLTETTCTDSDTIDTSSPFEGHFLLDRGDLPTGPAFRNTFYMKELHKSELSACALSRSNLLKSESLEGLNSPLFNWLVDGTQKHKCSGDDKEVSLTPLVQDSGSPRSIRSDKAKCIPSNFNVFSFFSCLTINAVNDSPIAKNYTLVAGK